ncbi:M23 family metallopeptidase [Microbacterium sp. BLY]|uniref:M23 family metallopeptidase n=1 Tax=Microbacterium sp. BLY TaxID=2823280 RepID=UPI001B33477A|nr:M23 family metallopeptidase [Microbacterium sp. BLY]MBP3978891.1 M23 family metallopeptidase [Microbacterium sp. BLY]
MSLGAAALGLSFLTSAQRAAAAGTYLRPCGAVPISDSWQGHRNRNPPSGEPGTDYSVTKGTPVRAATDGIIVDRKDTTSTATGRFLALRGDDGNYLRYLHLQSSAVAIGTRVTRGQVIAYSGASGFGKENGYGPHVHVSLWIGGTPTQQGFTNTVDFEKYVGEPTTTPEDPVPVYHRHQGTYTVPIGTSANTRLYFSNGVFDMAAGAGGNGLYLITTHASFTGLTPDKTLMLQYYLLNATTNVYSGGFSATFPGVVGGEASVEFSTMIPVPAGNHLFVAARCPQGGVNQTSVAKMSLNFGAL